MRNSANKTLLTCLVLVVVGVIAYGVLTMPDQRTPTERVGDAIHALPEGPGEAAEQLEKRTPGEKLGDAVEDATDNQ